MTDMNRPLLGEPNAPCRTCGSPLAVDQRYCLHCGARRAEARLPFLDILAQQVPSRAGAAAASGQPPPPPDTWLGRLSANAAAVAGVACLLLALGVGVLIGGLGKDDSAANATPQVISVGSAAPRSRPWRRRPEHDRARRHGDDRRCRRGGAQGHHQVEVLAEASSATKATNDAVKDLDEQLRRRLLQEVGEAAR